MSDMFFSDSAPAEAASGSRETASPASTAEATTVDDQLVNRIV